MSLQRFSPQLEQNFSLTTSLTTTPAIEFGSDAGGVIIIPTGSSITALEWYVAEKVDGTYVRLYKADNSAVADPATVAAARAYPFPDEAFGAKYLKIVVDAAGTVKIQRKA